MSLVKGKSSTFYLGPPVVTALLSPFLVGRASPYNRLINRLQQKVGTLILSSPQDLVHTSEVREGQSHGAWCGRGPREPSPFETSRLWKSRAEALYGFPLEVSGVRRSFGLLGIRCELGVKVSKRAYDVGPWYPILISELGIRVKCLKIANKIQIELHTSPIVCPLDLSPEV